MAVKTTERVEVFEVKANGFAADASIEAGTTRSDDGRKMLPCHHLVIRIPFSRALYAKRVLERLRAFGRLGR